jgi:hypothetical protein
MALAVLTERVGKLARRHMDLLSPGSRSCSAGNESVPLFGP